MEEKMQQPKQGQAAGGQENPSQDTYDIFVAQGIKLASIASDKLQGNSSIDLLGNTLFEIVSKIETEKKTGLNLTFRFWCMAATRY